MQATGANANVAAIRALLDDIGHAVFMTAAALDCPDADEISPMTTAPWIVKLQEMACEFGQIAEEIETSLRW